MPTWVKWVLVIVVIYLGVSEGLPWVQRQLAAHQGGAATAEGSSKSAECVAAARRASDAVANEAARFVPPIDAAAWSQAASDLRRAVGDARVACTCTLESCRTASDALSEIEGVISSLDSAASGGSPPLNLASHLNDADDLLNRARELSRRGE